MLKKRNDKKSLVQKILIAIRQNIKRYCEWRKETIQYKEKAENLKFSAFILF